MSTKTEIEIEMSECESLVEMTTPPVAAIMAHITEREVYRMVEADEIHFFESGRVFICLRSLAEVGKGTII